MQFFGIGFLELAVVLVLAAIVIGPERLPAFAADLAKWIRQARAYANHLTKDFNQVVSELEKEAGASREDWKEIASVVGLHTGQIGKELQKAVGQLEEAASDATAQAAATAPANGTTTNGAANGVSYTPGGAIEPPPLESTHDEPVATGETETEADADKPWYVPERSTRRRSVE